MMNSDQGKSTKDDDDNDDDGNDDESNGDDDEEDDDGDDLITLSGCGRISQWTFPANKTDCPVVSCKKQFGVRSDAIDHYKKRHSQLSIYCSQCDKPIVAPHISHFKNHYIRRHPDVDPETNFFNGPSTSGTSEKKTVSNLNVFMKSLNLKRFNLFV